MGVFCDMKLDNPQLVFQPGEVVAGRIVLTIDERALIKSLALKVSGFAATQWEKPLKDKKNNKENNELEIVKIREVYTNREDYISTTHYFLGSDAATAKIVEAGCYHYNFSVRLPGNCPSVFESAFGHIRYEMNVFIDYPEYNHSCYLHNIHITSPLDLRKITGLTQETNIEVVEKKSFVKFWTRPLQLQLNVPQTGFVPGDNVSIHVKVLNYELLTLTEIIYKLNLVATYTGLLKKKAKMNISRSNLAMTVHSLFGQNGNVVQHLQNLHVPETPPTLGLAECRCIQISYEIEVAVITSQKQRNVSAFLPITIGTIPSNSDLQIVPRDTAASAPSLSAARSLDNLMDTSCEDSKMFLEATAPTLDTPTQETPATAQIPQAPPYLPGAVPASTFREADFMTTKRKKNSKSLERLDDFKPKYLYYEMHNLQNVRGQQNVDLQSQQQINEGTENNNEKTRN